MTAENTEKTVRLVFSDGSPDVVLPMHSGTMGPDVIDITTLYKQSGKFTYDPGFMSTASCRSERSAWRRPGFPAANSWRRRWSSN